MSIFGPLVPSSVPETAVLATLSTWADTYLAEVERQQNLPVPTLQRPRSYQTSYDFENWTEGQLPALIAVCNGTTGDAERQDGGRWAVWFDVQVGVLVEDTTEANARRVAQLHQAALDGILVQRGSLGGVAARTRFVGRTSRLPDVDNRTLAIAESTFHVLIADVADEELGPATADPPITPYQPYPSFPAVQETEITLTSP